MYGMTQCQSQSSTVVSGAQEFPKKYLQWSELDRVGYLVSGGSGAIYTANYEGCNVVVKVSHIDS